MSPHELYFGKKSNLAHLRALDSTKYVHVLKETRRKLDTKDKSVSWSTTRTCRRVISVITREPNRSESVEM